MNVWTMDRDQLENFGSSVMHATCVRAVKLGYMKNEDAMQMMQTQTPVVITRFALSKWLAEKLFGKEDNLLRVEVIEVVHDS